MPVQYGSIILEGKAVREHAGMFDVSHMARLSLKGQRVLEYLEHVTSNDVAKLGDNEGQYSLLPNEEAGVSTTSSSIDSKRTSTRWWSTRTTMPKTWLG